MSNSNSEDDIDSMFGVVTEEELKELDAIEVAMSESFTR
jgi:hypothetical protein